MIAARARRVTIAIVIVVVMSVAMSALVASPASAQQPQQTPAAHYAELRADVVTGRGTALQGGAGVVFPLGVYVRLGVNGALGATWRNEMTHSSGRVDVIGRFLLDPFRELPVGLSLGGGVSLPYVRGDERVRPYLTAVIDVEGRRRGGVTPALQLGLGGGARIGVVLRMSPVNRR